MSGTGYNDAGLAPAQSPAMAEALTKNPEAVSPKDKTLTKGAASPGR